jgi:HAD superfamily hydrolase (TIGR01509 family)
MTADAGTCLQAVLWDMDGTLIATEELWMAAEIATMSAYGGTWSAEDQAIAIGGPIDRVITYMAERVDQPEHEVGLSLTRGIEKLMREEDITWMPGARELHDALTAAGVPQALVSNSWRELIECALAEAHTAFDVVIAGDEVTRPKPDPLPYATACAALGADPARTVVIEDSPTGVAAGLAAGCVVVGVPHAAHIAPAPRLLLVESLAEIDLTVLRRLAGG